MNIYYIDYENVSSQGLKGVEALTENDEVNLLYSKKADNVKIEMLTMLMASKAKIRFLPVHVGTPNALDFQLVTLLFLNYRDEDHCYIISKDSGYDCCIKTAAENGAPNVARFPNIESALKGEAPKRTRRGRRTALVETKPDNAPSPDQSNHQETADKKQAEAESGSKQKKTAAAVRSSSDASSKDKPEGNASQNTDVSPAEPEAAAASAVDEQTKKKPARRRGRKKAVQSEAESSEAVQQPLASEQKKDPDSQKEAELQKDTESQKETAHKKDADSQKEAPRKKDSGNQKEAAHSNDSGNEQPVDARQNKPEEHVLQQRYLSRQFEQRVPQPAAPKSEADRPVSILSVIRRRNDVQLDMHQIDVIREALKNSKNKQQFYSYFVKKLGQKQGIELYHSVKSSYTDLVNSNLQ